MYWALGQREIGGWGIISGWEDFSEEVTGELRSVDDKEPADMPRTGGRACSSEGAA